MRPTSIPVTGRQQILSSIQDNLYGTTCYFRKKARDDIMGIRQSSRAERTSHVRHNDSDFVLWKLQELRKIPPEQKRRLMGCPYCQRIRIVVVGCQNARGLEWRHVLIP